tara:strand:- start:74 stop:715 length:642 start_codon:yes stop_codon:yes gene_type:complete
MVALKNSKVAIIDYEFGNATSVKNALDYLKINNEIKTYPTKLNSFTHIILPGDGFFPATMKILKSNKWDKAIYAFYKNNKKKVIGICVGFQILFNFSFEGKGCKGLNLVKGKCIKIKDTKKKIRLPHIGFNKVKMLKSKQSDFFYFIHSYAIKVDDRYLNENFSKINEDLGISNYGFKFLSYFNTKRLAGFQFHPEKSSDQGLKLLREAIELI